MQHVVIRTRLHALIVERLLVQGYIENPFHLIIAYNTTEPSYRTSIEKLFNSAKKVTELPRPRLGFLRIFIYFLWLLWRCRTNGDQIFLANVNWYHFGLALKMTPGLKINTFDDGSANVQTQSIFFSDRGRELNSIHGRIAKLIFPRGVALFVRSRIERHYTIYPGLKNVVDVDRLVPIDIDWAGMANDVESRKLPEGVSKILLGTVYKESATRSSLCFSSEMMRAATEWAELYIPHPRQVEPCANAKVISGYPAEPLIGHYASIGKVVVAHFNSSAAIPFLSDPRVQLIDISQCTDLHDLRLKLDFPGKKGDGGN